MGIFGFTSWMYGSDEIHYGNDGRGYVLAYASEALTAKTPYALIWGQYGLQAEATADDTRSFIIGVPEDSFASGTKGCKIYVKGIVEDVITPSLSVTAGHAFGILNNVLTDVGAAYSGAATEWGVCATTSTTSTTQDIILTGHLITNAT